MGLKHGGRSMEQASASEVLATGGAVIVRGRGRAMQRRLCCAGRGAAPAPGAVQCRRTWVGVVSLMRVPGGGGELTGKLIYFHRAESEKVAGAVCEG